MQGKAQAVDNLYARHKMHLNFSHLLKKPLCAQVFSRQPRCWFYGLTPIRPAVTTELARLSALFSTTRSQVIHSFFTA